MQPDSRPPLPLMKAMDDAVAICQRDKANFYLTTIVIEAWLSEVKMRLRN